ncbi:TolC family protein, partial [uncultured Sphingomonas sp.]|uniref:TolC family protein n=1 Tax=uncultured Sphingomonas sp. TaxID=158754 RepID=UPI0035CA5717
GLRSLFSTDSFQGTGSGAISFPLFDAGRRRATVDIRRELREETYQQYRSTVLAALRDVEDPLARLDAERRRNAALVRAIADAGATERATSAQYRTGFTNQTALLDAQVALLQARENKAQSDAQLRQETAALFKAMGGGWRTDEAVKPR